MGKDERVTSAVEKILKAFKFEDLVQSQKDDLTLITIYNLLAANENKNESLFLKLLTYISESKIEKDFRTIQKQTEVLHYIQSLSSEFKNSTIR